MQLKLSGRETIIEKGWSPVLPQLRNLPYLKFSIYGLKPNLNWWKLCSKFVVMSDLVVKSENADFWDPNMTSFVRPILKNLTFISLSYFLWYSRIHVILLFQFKIFKNIKSEQKLICLKWFCWGKTNLKYSSWSNEHQFSF